jgi:HK97 family phage prohead protease
MRELSTSTLESRDFTSRAQASGRTITAIGVPYDRETLIWDDWYESFAPGSVEDDGAILRYGHREPIGRITTAADTDEGRQIAGTVSATARGDEVVTLVTDGVLTRMSIGFYPITWETTRDDDGRTHIRHTKVKAVEYSVVEFPAYDDAQIESIRSTPVTPTKETPMPTTDALTRADLDEVTQAVQDLDREVKLTRSMINVAPASEAIPFEFRSIGEYAKALAGALPRDGAADMARRAFEGSVIGETIARPQWLGNIEKRMSAKQTVLGMFTHTMDLPAEGMTIEYAQHAGDTTVVVAEQTDEGDDLTSGKPAKYEVKSTDVKTYGGVGEMSVQAIERATISLLDDLLYDQALKYALQIEQVTRTLFETTVTTNEATPVQTIPSLADATVNDWTDVMLALLDAYDDTPWTMDGLAVSTDVFKALAHLDRSPKALQFTSAPTDHQGTIRLQTGAADYAEIPVIRVPKWTGQHAAGYAQEAIRAKESAGAPLRLQDSNIVNLTKAFAVYGYAAIWAPKPGLIKPVKFTA